MTYAITPRTLVYKDIESFDYFLGEETDSTLEREFYDRLIERPFIMESDYPPQLVLTVLTNARYIYYLIQCEENSPSLSLNTYLAKAAEGIDEAELKCHITAATMALVHDWLNLKLNEGSNKYEDFSQKIMFHFYDESETVTSESKRDFFALRMDKINLPSNLYTLFNDIRTIEDAATNAPIKDVARGIDYIMDCYDSPNGTNAERHFFLNKILNRLDNEKVPIDDIKVIENARTVIKAEMDKLMYSLEPESFSIGLSLDDISIIPIEEDFEIPPEMEKHIGWILDRTKAPRILKVLYQFMDGKTTPKDILKPLCAALHAQVIRKPYWEEYKIVFKNFPLKSDSSLNHWVTLDGHNSYMSSVAHTAQTYKKLVELFIEIGES